MLNKQIQEEAPKVIIIEARKLLQESFTQVIEVITSLSNDELFTKKLYPWTGSTSIGAYLISNTSSHYDWAYKMIKKSMGELGK